MKNILLLTIMMLLPLSSFAGPRVIGNGGDVYALQFVAIADKISAYFQEVPTEGIDTKLLAQAIQYTKVESTNQPLLLNGLPKDAINYPEKKRIILSRQRWNEIPSEDKPALVLHEYLGILKIEDASYKYSKKILGNFQLSSSLPGSDSFLELMYG